MFTISYLLEYKISIALGTACEALLNYLNVTRLVEGKKSTKIKKFEEPFFHRERNYFGLCWILRYVTTGLKKLADPKN